MAPWHFLYFFPLPHGHFSFGLIFAGLPPPPPPAAPSPLPPTAPAFATGTICGGQYMVFFPTRYFQYWLSGSNQFQKKATHSHHPTLFQKGGEKARELTERHRPPPGPCATPAQAPGPHAPALLGGVAQFGRVREPSPSARPFDQYREALAQHAHKGGRARPRGYARWNRRRVVSRCASGVPRSRRAPRAPPA